MDTLILGGGSLKNKAWVDETAQKLQPEISTKSIYWNGWESGQDAKIDFGAEIAKVVESIGNKPFNMIAKSVGTLVGLGAVKETGNLVHKLIICGIPLHDFSLEEIKSKYEVLTGLPAENVIVLQNEQDPHGSFEEAKAFLGKINPAIKIVKKTGEFAETHNYPYPEDFKSFLLA